MDDPPFRFDPPRSLRSRLLGPLDTGGPLDAYHGGAEKGKDRAVSVGEGGAVVLPRQAPARGRGRPPGNVERAGASLEPGRLPGPHQHHAARGVFGQVRERRVGSARYMRISGVFNKCQVQECSINATEGHSMIRTIRLLTAM